ncbi:pyrroloquinoline quinone biosynthesis protein PqqF [Pseudomonas gingeri]|uniref:pyrroloquinoline quinone biosynthesis protein PqqF n=1 Tax=Pseudomonas gingeri TaxID=117681 RepID=UPI0015A122C5|nr:pyrroloquinoline quinone biosynthesis protein PqqF [Pseudomonas gingeri]NWA01987.1 pyrroloquinoline quinone biosynthesis protein PqqF [Pseudomonas gingeri]NWA17995.1 pyrroloquinoline quinone biosynthesis protein PqqF [Pseudomonas gingeri]NWA53350.1 pyrroloquinoline quinone biosynthesis protein PqqF [Pseudomonas gingeri]NWA95337.1 pyrroloquinoline quinone biosynthesis protein PqqF [Pseudomonas gingeri]NWB00215.1 pyrroloquinoline quinone biosynthesis protein PqqF [Pseudomonas gingeri]
MSAPISPAPEWTTLANGLRVSLRPVPQLKRCAAVLRVAAGSHDAPPAWPGLAHFLEHLFFLGTVRFPAAEGMMAYVQRQGGQVNARTGERTTEFFFELPPRAFAGGLERLCDMLAQPRLALDDQRREREVLEAEFIAWSRDAVAQRQFQLYDRLSADHPLRGLHAGNRSSLRIEEPAFQQALQDFYRSFYQTGQMTLSLVGPQSLDELKTLTQALTADLRPGQAIPQEAPPTLIDASGQTYPQPDPQRLDLLLTYEALPAGSRPALDFLCTWLNDSQPGGLSAELRSRLWIDSLNAAPIYQFAGQALLHIEFKLTPDGVGQTASIQALLGDWLAFFRSHADWPALRREYRLLQVRKARVGSALERARRDSEQSPLELGEAGMAALKDLLRQTSFAPVDNLTASWQLPPANPFLRSTAPAEHPGLIRGQTSAHRGLRTFAQDRLRGRQTAAITYRQVADDSTEAVIYLRWQLDISGGAQLLHARLDHGLQNLRYQAHQAGVELSFTTHGDAWQLKLSGVREPMPAILEQTLRTLASPADNLWHSDAGIPERVPLIPIRELLRQLSEQPAIAKDVPSLQRAQDLQTLWSGATWHGLALGFPPAAQPALNSALGRVPGRVARQQTPVPFVAGEKRWQTVACDTREQALLLFCPSPTPAPIDEACWRLLGHLLQAPFYQRLRVELQLGYAVFSAVRQIDGRTGLLLGVQSPDTPLAELLGHVESFLSQLPEMIGALDDSTWNNQRETLAGQFAIDERPLDEAAELLWQAQLADHSSDHLEQLASAIRTLEREQVLRAARQLDQAAGGWWCLANGPGPTSGWQLAR